MQVETHLDLNVNYDTSADSKSLQQCIDSYKGKQTIEDYMCSICNVRGNATKTIKLLQYGDYAIISLARTKYNARTNSYFKDKSPITVTRYLNLGDTED